jgi:hypothetical protein
MKLVKKLRKFIKNFDLFSTSKFLRYGEDEDYKTASGGLCSLIVFIVFLVLFMSTAIQTVNMQIINWSSSSELLFDPSETIIPINPPHNPFVFGIKLFGVNLNDNASRLFDIVMVERHYQNGLIELPNKTISLVPCTLQHFSLTDEIEKAASTLQIENWLCPPLNYSFSLQGKFTSPDMKEIEIGVYKCNDALDPSRPCANSTTIDQHELYFEQFILSLNYINPLINPGD